MVGQQGKDRMGIGAIGRIPSFWQDNQNSLSQRKYLYRAEKAQKALIDVMYSTQANLSRGLSSIANQTALKRVNSQLSAAVQSALQSLGSSTSAVSGTSTASSSSSIPAPLALQVHRTSLPPRLLQRSALARHL